MSLPHLASLLLNTPLAITPGKLSVLLTVVGPRIGLADSPLPGVPREGESPLREDDDEDDESPVGLATIAIHGSLVPRSLGLSGWSGVASFEGLTAALNRLEDDDEVEGVLLDVDSFGGSVQGLFDAAERIQTFPKPIVAFADSNAFSAAFALASAADSLIVRSTSGVGSVGVVAAHVDQSQAEREAGLKVTLIHAGAKKVDGNPHEPLSDAARKDMQAQVDKFHAMFVDLVAKQRGMDAAAVRATEAGQFFGQEAVDVGFADAVGTRDDAINLLASRIRQDRSHSAFGARAPWPVGV